MMELQKRIRSWGLRAVEIVAIAISPMTTFAAAVDATWIGGPDGDWKTAANWDTEDYPSGAGSIARFTNSVTITSSGGITYCEVHVADNCAVAHNTSANCTSAANFEGEVVFDVGEGATFTQGGSIPNIYGGNAITFVKTGKGTASFGGCIGHVGSQPSYFYKTVDVRGGTLKMTCNYGPRLTLADNYMRIRSNANFLDARMGTGQMISNKTVVEIDEDGILDFGGKGGTLRGIIGSGSAILGGASATVTLRGENVAGGSQGTFTGTISGSVEFAPTNGMPFVVGAANTLAAATVSTIEPETGRALAFAPGIGTFQKSEPAALAGYTTDMAGSPIAWQVVKTSAYTHTASGDDDWSDVEFVTMANVTEKSGGTWTIGNISMSPGTTFEISSAAGGNEIHFGGGTMTGVSFTVSKPGYEIWFDGVNFSSGSGILGSQGVWHQTGGTVALSGLNPASSTTTTFATNDVFYFITGGSLTSTPTRYYQIGTGIEASGDAHVRLLNGTYSSNANRHKLSHSTHGYWIKVRGNAIVYAQDLNYYYYKGGACTAGVEVAENGVFETDGNIGTGGDASNSPHESFSGFFRFDGGAFRSTATGNHTIPDNYQTKKSFTLDVKTGGAVIDVSRTNDTEKLTFRFGFTNCTDGVTDGGFTKKGLGTFTASEPHFIAGPVKVLNGRVETSLTGNGGNPLGTGSVELSRGMITMTSASAQKLASGAGATITMAAPGTIRKATAGSAPLEIGPTEATSTPLRRANHAVMAIACGTSVSQTTIYSFDTYPVKINGGIGDMPVFAWERTIDYSNYGKGRGEKTFKFLSCDAEGNLSTREPDYLNVFPDVDDSSAFVRIARNQTVSVTQNKHVGCLDVYGGNYHSTDKKNQVGGIGISSGVKLTVGGGSGTIAKVLLNNNFRDSADYGEATIAGEGTLDFGAAEGLFVVNDAVAVNGNNAGDTRRPAVVSCRVAGTGGVTFASPYTMDNSDVEHNVSDKAGRMRAVAVRASNTWTGGTWIDGLAVMPGKPDSLGSGTVNVQGDDVTGGELLFAPDYSGGDFITPLQISGHGFLGAPALTNLWGGKAAVVAMCDVSLSGGVTLAADSGMFVGTNATLALASAVTGTGTLTVKGPGTLALEAPISCTGGIDINVGAVEIRPESSGTLTLPASAVPDGATLFVIGSGAPDGCGTLVVDGDVDLSRLNIRFGPKSSFAGTTYTIIRATGTISGTLDDATLPSGRWRYEYCDDRVLAIRKPFNMVISFK